ncbi:hypothetical protein F5Y19DRAFT_422438 [Xylariaceae sp. FL1651]|nr:hypothetical protein F5Y19DRAFT_422438 [Xylariaceae sp. FL1651]
MCGNHKQGSSFKMDASGTIPFILAAGTGKEPQDPDTRKFIRRHVMLGKNRGKVIPHRRKPTRKAKATIGSSIQQSSLPLSQEASLSKIPPQIGSDLSSLAWADSVDISTIAGIMEFSNFTKKSMYKIEIYIDFPRKDIQWLEPMLSDAAWLHIMAFSSRAFFDVLQRRSTQLTDHWASPHFASALRLLRERLLGDDQSDAITNSTIQVVIALATHASLQGQYEVAKCHMLGLQRIVELRGGIDAFRSYPKLILTILRSDIGLSLHSGTAPLFSQDPLADHQWPYPQTAFSHIQDDYYPNILFSVSSSSLDCLDHELNQAWRVLRSFSLQVNNAAFTNSRLSRELLLDTMTSVMYRLLYLRFTPASLNEVVRLSLLAFCSGVFIQWQQGIPMGPTYFPISFQESLAHFRRADDLPYFMLWVLMVGAMAVFSEDDNMWLRPWLKTNMKLCGVDSWNGMRAILHSFLWIDMVHEYPAHGIFAEIFTMDRITG